MEIDITAEKKRFTSFLKIKNNINVIFSGIFGIGKTYFIHNFFDNHKDYVPIYLTPVQYSVSSNEDIFEYIKIDILFQLIGKGIDFEKTCFSFSLCTQMYIMENISELIASLLKAGEKIKYETNIITSFLKLHKKLDNYRESLNINEKKDVIDYLSTMSNKIGSIYENNAITELIQSLISTLKNENQEIILIIDDLDRIDPEHIFRILNILSVHENFSGVPTENKFGFDKTILVCDIQNIKYIYSAKYGINADFNGYIDKFYSNEMYYFNNIDNITHFIPDLLSSISSDRTDFGLNDKACITHNACKGIVSSFIRNQSINLRILTKCYKKHIINNASIHINQQLRRRSEFPCFAVFDFIRTMFRTLKDMEQAILKLRSSNFSRVTSDDILRIFIQLSDYKEFKPGKYNCSGKIIELKDDSNTRRGIAQLDSETISQIDVSLVLKEAFKAYETLSQ